MSSGSYASQAHNLTLFFLSDGYVARKDVLAFLTSATVLAIKLITFLAVTVIAADCVKTELFAFGTITSTFIFLCKKMEDYIQFIKSRIYRGSFRGVTKFPWYKSSNIGTAEPPKS